MPAAWHAVLSPSLSEHAGAVTGEVLGEFAFTGEVLGELVGTEVTGESLGESVTSEDTGDFVGTSVAWHK